VLSRHPSYLGLPEPGGSFWTSLRYFDLTRLGIAVVLLGLQMTDQMRLATDPRLTQLFWETTLAYGGLGLGFFFLSPAWRSRFHIQLLLRVVVDVAVMTIWLYAGGGIKSGLALLFVVPVAAGSMLAPGMLALFFASLAALCVLGESVLRVVQGDGAEVSLFQAGLTGGLYFAASAVTRSLAGRLIRQEELAQRRGETLRHQLEINRLIIGDLSTGVVMLGADGQIHTTNRSAQRLLGLDLNTQQLTAVPYLGPLAACYERWLRQGTPADATAIVTLDIPSEQGTTERRLRLRFFNPKIEGAGDSVVLIDDLGELSDQARQLKLAAMGRLTASIAHEIRNPLAAISHAGALLSEDELTPLHNRLVGIISENANRLNRIVEDVLQLARGRRQGSDRIDLCDWLKQTVIRFCGDRNVDALRVSYALHASDVVAFDENQLRQVVVNLLDNALRYASDHVGAVRLTTRFQDAGRLELWIEDDGPGVPQADRVQLFEPFHTTHPQGTGLGLYLAREFCLNNDADLQYVPSPNRPAIGNGYGFVLRLPRARPDVDNAGRRGTMTATRP
jgi:two-component system sensor histidine kinase PilS (NtrC family)